MATTTKTVFLTDENGNLLVDSNGRPRALTFTVIEGKSLRLAERETIPTVTYAELKTYSESVQTYTGITNTAKFSVEDVAVFQYIVSDRGNTRSYITAQVSAVNDTSLTANGIGISVAGADGQDGVTPHIGSNKHWYIGEEDTGIVAEGKDGATPEIGENGNWYINGEDTGKSSKGAKGDDGKSITSATAGTVLEADGYTVTPVTFRLSDGSSLPAVPIKAKNAEVEVIDFGTQSRHTTFDVTTEQMNKMLSDTPPLVKFTISDIDGYKSYTFTLERTARYANRALYGGCYYDGDISTLVGFDAHGTTAQIEVYDDVIGGGGGGGLTMQAITTNTFAELYAELQSLISSEKNIVAIQTDETAESTAISFTLEGTTYEGRVSFLAVSKQGSLSATAIVFDSASPASVMIADLETFDMGGAQAQSMPYINGIALNTIQPVDISWSRSAGCTVYVYYQ